MAHCLEALRINPGYAIARMRLGHILVTLGRPGEALMHYRGALELPPDSDAILNDTAWLLATHPDENIRDPSEAVRLALHAADLTKHKDPRILDTLAEAFAASGRFDRAATIAKKALRMAEQDPDLTGAIRQQLALYRNETPFYELPKVNE